VFFSETIVVHHPPDSSTLFVWLFALSLGTVPLAAAAPEVSSLSLGFREKLHGWVFRPGDESQVSFVDDEQHGKALVLQPGGRLLGVETKRLTFGRELSEEQAYRARAWLKNEGLQQGVFAFSMYCFDARGKALKQIAFAGFSPQTKPHGWRRFRGTFGPGTSNPLPAGTKSVCLRFSFYEREKNCRGKVLVADVGLEPYHSPVPPGWPTEIVAQVGDLGIRFESRSFWTLYRLDYHGDRLCLDRFGSHYGSVASFPGVGFIGSGHTENEDEQVLKLKLFVDGKLVITPPAKLTCRRIRLWKQSRLRDLALTTEVTVEDDRVVEDVRLRREHFASVIGERAGSTE